MSEGQKWFSVSSSAAGFDSRPQSAISGPGPFGDVPQVRQFMNANLKRWMQNEDYRAFLRQIACDVLVAHRNGVPSEEIDDELDMLIQDVSKEIRDLNPPFLDVDR